MAPQPFDGRSAEDIRAHYDVERELADRLRHATRAERSVLYTTVYEELFARVPSHSQLTRKTSPEQTQKAVQSQMTLLGRFLTPSTTLLEIGAGDCALSLAATGRVSMVYALDVSPTISRPQAPPPNFRLLLSDGINIPLTDHSVTVAYSNQLMEHLHPEDAAAQVREVHRVLAPGGVYLCVTPHRMSGPHDISRRFDRVATGFHLKEYTPMELTKLFRMAGFSRVVAYLGGRGRFVALPPSLLHSLELPFASLPHSIRVTIARRTPFGFLRSIWMAAYK